MCKLRLDPEDLNDDILPAFDEECRQALENEILGAYLSKKTEKIGKQIDRWLF